MAMHMKNEQETPKNRKGKEKRGFYIALGLCITAIAIAAWSTYDTMSDFLEPAPTVVENSQVSRDPAEATPESDRDDPESAVPEGHANGTASEVEVGADATEPTENAEDTTADPIEETPAEEIAAPEEPVEETMVQEEAEEETETDAPAEDAEETAAEAAQYTISERFLRPVASGEVLSAFSDAPVYSETMRDYRTHLGTDYLAKHGETVKSVANGIVKDTYTDMLLGNIIVIEHGNVEVRYCGLGETFLVDPGEIVSAGQDIGSVTAAPFESAMDSHLHLEATEDGTVIDPEKLFS